MNINTFSSPLIIAGPCSAESLSQVLSTAQALKAKTHTKIFRAGVWKPRTQVGSFEGHGEEALKWLQEVKAQTGLQVTTEVATAKHVELCLKYGIDVLWIGARTTPNPFAIQEIAESLKGTQIPVMVKNPLSPDLLIWKGALERFMKAGITHLMAIHRGFSAPESKELRNLPQWKIPIQLKIDYPQLPLICDPSHICGKRMHLQHIAQMAMDINFDGLMVEVHPDPDHALSDAQQQITPDNFERLLSSLLLKRNRYLSEEALQELRHFRREIDQLDYQLLEILKQRMQISEKISTFKSKHNLSLFQLERFQELMQDRMNQARPLGLPSDFIAEIFNTIHEQSILKQNEGKKTGKE